MKIRKITFHRSGKRRIFLPALMIILLFCLSAGISTPMLFAAEDEQRPVIPPGNEDMLGRVLTPPGGIPADEIILQDIAIERFYLRLQFTKDGRALAPVKMYSNEDKQADTSNCLAAGKLRLCGDAGEKWLQSYAQWLTSSGGDGLAAGAWSSRATKKDPVPIKLPIKLPDHDTGILPALWLLIACLISLMIFIRGGGIRQHPYRRWILTGQGWIFLILAALMALAMLADAGRLFSDLKYAWLESGRSRALLTAIYHALLLGGALLLALRLIKVEAWKASRLIFPLAIAAALALLPACYLLGNFHAIYPGLVWQELEPSFWMSQGNLPHFDQFMMGGASVGGAIFALLGKTPETLNLLRLCMLAFFGLALAASSRMIYESRAAALMAVALWAANPLMPMLAAEGWWFLLAGGFIALSFGAMIQGARRQSIRWSLLALLLSQLAFEIRPEAVVLFFLFFIIQALYAFPRTWPGRLGLMLAAVNLLRLWLLSIQSGQFGGQHLAVNAAGYADLLMHLGGWLLAALAGVWMAGRTRFRLPLLLMFWFSGTLLLYLLVNTTPTARETALLAVPIWLLGGGLACGLKDSPHIAQRRRPWLKGFLCLSLLAMLFFSSLDTRLIWSERREAQLDVARRILPLARKIPDETPLLLHHVYLNFVQPQRPVLIDRPRKIDIAELRRLISPYPQVACINDEGDANACCFYEISTSGLDRKSRHDKYVGSRCWPVEMLNRKARILVRDRNLLVLILTPSGGLDAPD